MLGVLATGATSIAALKLGEVGRRKPQRKTGPVQGSQWALTQSNAHRRPMRKGVRKRTSSNGPARSHQPASPPRELAGVGLLWILLPFGATTYQTPPKALTPCPFVC